MKYTKQLLEKVIDGYHSTEWKNELYKIALAKDKTIYEIGAVTKLSKIFSKMTGRNISEEMIVEELKETLGEIYEVKKVKDVKKLNEKEIEIKYKWKIYRNRKKVK